MSTHILSSVEFNQEGYLANFSGWNDELAKALAEEEGIELSDCHWHVIKFLRHYYETFEVAPSPREVVNAVGQHIIEDVKCTTKKLDQLFGEKGCKSACRIAGLPVHFCRAC